MDLPNIATNVNQQDVVVASSKATSLLRKSILLLSSSFLSQLIPFACLPILSRLYSPEQFADLTLFMLVATVLYTIGTGRFDLALMLPRNSRRALNLLQLGIAGCLVLAVLSFIVLLLNPFNLLSFVTPAWLLLLPIAVLATGCSELLSYWHNRLEAYSTLSKGLLGMQLTTAACKLGFYVQSSGLLFGHTLGRFFWFVYLLLNSKLQLSQVLKPPPIKYLLALVKRYRDFPRFNVTHSLLTAFSGGFLVLLLSLYGEHRVAGFVAFCRTLLFAPIGMLSASVGRVFFKEAAIGLATAKFISETTNLTFFFAAIATPLFVWAAFFAPGIFPYVFGESWADAGLVCSILLVVAFLMIFTSWPERVFEVAGHQRVLFSLQVSFDMLSVLIVLASLTYFTNPLIAVVSYAAIAVIFNLVYLGFAFKYASISMRTYWALLSYICALTTVASVICGVFKLSAMPVYYTWSMALIFSALLAFGGLKTKAYFASVK